MNIDQYSPQSGRFLKEDGTYINIADALGGVETGQIADIEKHAAHSGRFIKEDGTVINIAESIGSGGGGGGGSSDDSATPIIEEYNGQTIQCSMSADRPLQGLNLYATCEQKTTTGANLINPNELEIGGLSGLTGLPYDTTRSRIRTGIIPVTEGMRYFLSGYSPYAIANSHVFNGEGEKIAAFSNNDAIPSGGVSVRFSFSENESELTNEDVNALKSTLMFNKGESALPYEPYTGGIPSPNGDYPQEIQTISDFVVEVKNSIGEDATPQTLNIVIPVQGFYGIPVKSGGNYTDSRGQQWICDEFDYKRGKYIQRVRKVILNGSESEKWWHYRASLSKSTFVASRTFEGTKIGNRTSICNMFINKTGNVWDSEEKWIYSDHYTNQNKYFNIPKTTASTLEGWKTWLSTHPLEVLYSLATPVEYDLTNEQVEQFKKLKSYYGTTYIDNDATPACNMTAELVVDTKMYIDSKFTTLAGQILEMGV